MTTAAEATRTISRPFRPTARLLQLLGDELIATPRLAVFELIKNAYDADATNATVRLEVGREADSTITVADDGEGMTLEVLESVWLVPGNNHRQRQRMALRRTPRHRRLPIGEKGLGRFAAHKLGNRVNLVTRAAGNDECVVNVDWKELTAHQYLEEALVTIVTRPPETFTDEATGTVITIGDLRNKWHRGEIRRLHNQITSICSPFAAEGDFRAVMEVPGNEQWTSDLPDVKEILNRAFWHFSFTLQDGEFAWEYHFNGIPGIKLESRSKCMVADKLKLPKQRNDAGGNNKAIAEALDTEGIGPISGIFYSYDRDNNIRRYLPNQQAITSYLDEFGGVRVYRDDVRIYNYGEQGDDWLGLDLRRVNSPTRRISRNIILGAVHLSLGTSTELIEKTNREGFVDNDAYKNLQRVVLGAIEAFESERQSDKIRIRQITNSQTSSVGSEGMEGLLATLRRELAKAHVVNPAIESCLQRIANHYNEMQEAMLQPGMSGLNLAVLFHEVERGVRALYQAIRTRLDTVMIENQARSLTETLDGFSLLLRRNSQELHTATKLATTALQINKIRLEYHNIRAVCPLLDQHADGFRAKFAFNLVLGALTNLIDNAIYWLRVRWPDERTTDKLPERMLYVGVSHDLASSPAIVVADNGPGFQGDTPDLISRPFFTRKPEGMGLGLYYASVAMELQGGQLVFPTQGEVKVPAEFDGAVVALLFKED